jgi:hypothetical protein
LNLSFAAQVDRDTLLAEPDDRKNSIGDRADLLPDPESFVDRAEEAADRAEEAVEEAMSDARAELELARRHVHDVFYNGYELDNHEKKLKAHEKRSPDYQSRLALHRTTRAMAFHREDAFTDLANSDQSWYKINHNDIMSFKFLWIDYEPRCYWWECIEVVRRVFSTAILAAVGQGSKLQIAIALAVSIVYTATYIRFKPFVFDDDDLIAEISGWSITLTLFVCLMLRAEIALDRAAKESEIPNFKGSHLGRFPLVSADSWTSDHLSERSRSVDAFSGTRARGTLTLKRR